jgi:hypothetical protein
LALKGRATLTRDELAIKLEVFRRRRGRLNQALTDTRHDVDEWLTGHPNNGSISELNQLAMLLAERRELLQELIDVDDRFIDYLVASR